jgi:hypothetical protein
MESAATDSGSPGFSVFAKSKPLCGEKLGFGNPLGAVNIVFPDEP